MAAIRSARHVSRLTRDTLALVLAGGRGSRLKMLTDWRAKPAVPFGGKFRIIDFALSNCVNSGLRRICLLTQYKSHSLIRHATRGWSSLRGELGEFLEVIPAQQRVDEDAWYTGTADAVYQSLDIIASHGPRYALILAGDHVYKMDYGEMLASHVATEADITVACNVVPVRDASEFGVMAVDDQYRVQEFREKPGNPQPMPSDPGMALVSMGIYVFAIDYLVRELRRDAELADSSHDFGKDLIPYAVGKRHQVMAYPFGDSGDPREAYWRDVGTLDAYYLANMELLAADPLLDLYDPDWRIWTFQEQLPPAKLALDEEGLHGIAEDTMVSGGCVIEGGHVRRSLLFSNVRVESNCVLDEAVVLPDCVVEPGVRLSRVVIDKACRIPAGTIIGDDPAEDARRFHRTDDGVVLVTRTMLGHRGPYPSY
ncbi:MAG: glucose-1-phosphate adenylyltransferase [Gammaproteobacteria bacterium]|nr:MAG: glucose-1-phosphate adenylyltransferase [Gammaproteobacteria bacterium]